MVVSLIRVIILYCSIIFLVRLMGKKQVGELEPAELVVTVMISEFAAIPMQDTEISIFTGIIPVITLVVIEVVLSQISLKSRHFRRFISGKPSILIHNGNIEYDEMRKIRFNMDELLSQLRQAGCTSPSDVKYAVLETNGQLSVILKDENAPIKKKDLRKEKDK